MTADLVARLESVADDVDPNKSPGRSHREIAAEIRSIASALRSSGEAVMFAHTNLDQAISAALRAALALSVEGNCPRVVAEYSIPLYLHPATPASAWRPIAEAPRDGTQILGYWPDRGCHAVAFCSDGWWRRAQDEGALTPPVLWQSITPPTSTGATP